MIYKAGYYHLYKKIKYIDGCGTLYLPIKKLDILTTTGTDGSYAYSGEYSSIQYSSTYGYGVNYSVYGQSGGVHYFNDTIDIRPDGLHGQYYIYDDIDTEALDEDAKLFIEAFMDSCMPVIFEPSSANGGSLSDRDYIKSLSNPWHVIFKPFFILYADIGIGGPGCRLLDIDLNRSVYLGSSVLMNYSENISHDFYLTYENDIPGFSIELHPRINDLTKSDIYAIYKLIHPTLKNNLFVTGSTPDWDNSIKSIIETDLLTIDGYQFTFKRVLRDEYAENLVVMPLQHYKNACDAIRDKLDLKVDKRITSDQLEELIRSI